jgi:hypothetical protein
MLAAPIPVGKIELGLHADLTLLGLSDPCYVQLNDPPAFRSTMRCGKSEDRDGRL